MGEPIKIAKPTLERLPSYYQALVRLKKEDRQYVSSRELEELTGWDSSQVRKDFNQFWSGGRPGRGYSIDELIRVLEDLLGMKRPTDAVVVGAGRLGTALCSYPGFAALGLRIVAAFDNEASRIGQQIGDVVVVDACKITSLVRRLGVQLGIITVPAPAAQGIADQLIAGGVRALWNFAPIKLVVPDDIIVRNEDLAVGLLTLSHHLTRSEQEISAQK